MIMSRCSIRRRGWRKIARESNGQIWPPGSRAIFARHELRITCCPLTQCHDAAQVT
jgi:hypothetical protein